MFTVRGCVLVLSFAFLSNVSNAYELTEAKEKIFKYYPEYPFVEYVYSPPIMLDDYSVKHNVGNVSNPYPEIASAIVLNKMKNGDYDGWLSLMSDRTKMYYKKMDDTDDARRKRIDEWSDMFEKNNMILKSLVLVGRAQNTYVMVVWDRVGKEKTELNTGNAECKCFYYGWVMNEYGEWRLSRYVLKHPVFRRYVEKNVYALQ